MRRTDCTAFELQKLRFHVHLLYQTLNYFQEELKNITKTDGNYWGKTMIKSQ